MMLIRVDAQADMHLCVHSGIKQVLILVAMQENLSLGFTTRSYINWAVQPQKMARGLKFWI